jgi:hypothetical protein
MTPLITQSGTTFEGRQILGRFFIFDSILKELRLANG